MNDFDKLNEAMDQVDSRYLKEAGAARKKKRPLPWLGAMAAVLALVIFLNSGAPAPVITPTEGSEPTGTSLDAPIPTVPDIFGDPAISLNGGLLAAPEYPEMAPYPEDPNVAYGTPEYTRWTSSLRRQYNQPDGYAYGLNTFFTNSMPLFLAESDGNAVCSPLNIYMALAMLAETTGGSSRDSILTALGADSIESLRTQAGHVWNAHYRADGAGASLLANSLWLDDGFPYDRSTVDSLVNSYYASVYQGDLGSSAMNEALRDWLSQQTQGLLDAYIQDVSLPENTALTLASTVYFRARWDSGFSAGKNTQGTFHSPAGDIPVTFMNQTLSYGPYYYGTDYGAVRLDLEDAGVQGASAMWLILPDEGYEPWEILESGHALDMILRTDELNRNRTSTRVHLSLPKFDISGETDLKESLTALGLGDLYDPEAADFTAILPDTEGVRLGQTSHAARVAIDEEGITAAAYTVMMLAGAAPPPEEEVYFTLDRPFLFVITSADNLPLFAGVVNEP